MKTRRIVIASILGSLVLTVGLVGALAASSPSPAGDPTQDNVAMTAMHDTTGMESMHSTPAMERMHAAMPSALQAQCEAMHADMAAMHADMSGAMSGMMDSAEGTASTGMDAHHTTGMMG